MKTGKQVVITFKFPLSVGGRIKSSFWSFKCDFHCEFCNKHQGQQNFNRNAYAHSLLIEILEDNPIN